jgi:hypothetical protein
MDRRLAKPGSFDEKTLLKMNECVRTSFPICFDRAILQIFGADGKKRLDRIFSIEIGEIKTAQRHLELVREV